MDDEKMESTIDYGGNIPEVCENNGNCDPVEEDTFSSNESGIDETEFKTEREKSAKLLARQSSGSDQQTLITYDDLVHTLSTKKVVKADTLSEVELDAITNRLQLKSDRTNIRTRYGYDIGRTPYLYPEEALYLLDMDKIELFTHQLSLSVQRARSRLLISQRPVNTDKIAHCTTDEYLVYKDLSLKGYCLYRHLKENVENPSLANATASSSNLSSTSLSLKDHMDPSVRMEDDEDIIIEEDAVADVETDDVIEIDQPNGKMSGFKRKLSERSEDEDFNEDSDEPMEDEGIQSGSGLEYLINTGGDTFDSQAQVEPYPVVYTVDEADSDIEIVDEVIFSHGGVEIQEIGHSTGYVEDVMEDSEPIPSTSRGPPPPTQVVVDLVSSEDEEEDLRSFGSKIWSKFVPNSKLYVKVPPSSLIPSSIPVSDKVYEYDLKDKSDMSDLELEDLVDEVTLNDESHGRQQSSLTTAENWKEWRSNIFREARDVMNDSLLASPEYINGTSATEKLFLWENISPDNKNCVPFTNRIVFAVYGQHSPGFSRLNAFKGKPTSYISILRETEAIPDLKSFGSSIDGVPIINAIVCDSGDVVYLKGDSSPLNSLF